MKKILSLFLFALLAMSSWAGTNLFDASLASVASTWGPNDANPTATWEDSKLTIVLNAVQPGWQWGNQVAFNHNVAFDASKWYKVTYTLKANADCGGVTFKMDANNGMIYENQTINLTKDTEYNYEKVVQGVANGDKKIVWDFGYGAQNTTIEITNISIEETTAPEIDYFSGTATASSNNDNAYLSCDGNTNTRWASANADGNEVFWQRNYDEAQTFNRVKIIWEGAYGKSFKIQTCNSKDEGWTDIATVTGQELSGFPYTQIIELNSDVTAKYVRFQGVEKATDYGYSFWELEIYEAETSVLTSLDFSADASVCKVNNTVSLTATPKDQYGSAMSGTITYTVSPANAGVVTDGIYTAKVKGSTTITATCGSLSKEVNIFNYEGDNVALNKTVTAAGYNDASRLVDGNDGTEWQGDPSNGTSELNVTTSFDIDLSAQYDINIIAIHFEGACSDAYTIETSADNETWNTAYTFSSTLGVNNHTDYLYGENLLYANGVRYIKFTSTKNATQWGMKIFEFQAYGTETDVPDTEAPAFTTFKAEEGKNKVTLTLNATDNTSASITYEIFQDNVSLGTISANNGVDVTYLVSGLTADQEYSFYATATDKKNNVGTSATVKATPLASSAVKTVFGMGSGTDNDNAPYIGYYSITRNAEDKLTVNLVVTGSLASSSFIPSWNDNGNYHDLTKIKEGSYTYTSEDTYEEGTNHTCFFYFGGPRFDFTYTVGSQNDTYTRTVTSGNYGTICMPFNATVTGATLYNISGKIVNEGVVSGIALTEVASAEAGKAYIYKATANELTATYSAVAALGTNTGLVGNLNAEDATVAQGKYVIMNNLLHKVTGDEVTCGQYKAYIDLSVLDAISAPGRIIMNIEGEEIATGIDAIESNDEIIKFFENGQLMIKKGDVIYNALGQIVK